MYTSSSASFDSRRTGIDLLAQRDIFDASVIAMRASTVKESLLGLSTVLRAAAIDRYT